MHLFPQRESRAALILGVLLFLGATPVGAQTTTGGASDPWPFDWPRACLVSTEEVAVSIESCMRSVMYPHQVGDQGEPEVDAAAAAYVCRGARTREASRSLASCVKRILYERSGLGERRPDVRPGDAALACQNATSHVAASNVEDCMRRLLYERSGLGARREDMSAGAAASVCQGTVAPPVRANLAPYIVPGCLPPSGSEASRLVEECVRRLMYRRSGLGERRRAVAAELAVYACQGALEASP